ncbi:MAG: arsenate reductase (glutaredoxin) [Zoogloeaceae bacterium]|nr:arsenate reductase (glutaredoxin) [Rhodocyclaceae bacterium]MCP5237039.1 arsenate reductase (glutaredoxin) [Zoogloeaceae bacterium]
MSDLVIYHNPRCGKSRGALALLREQGCEPDVVEYLKQALDAALLKDLLARLGMPASELVRRGESVFKEKYRGREMSEDDWIAAMVADPILIERPIVVRGARAVVARPPERVGELFD